MRYEATLLVNESNIHVSSTTLVAPVQHSQWRNLVWHLLQALVALCLFPTLTSPVAIAQALVCDVTCTPDRTAPSYTGAIAARGKMLNARGSSSPTVPKASAIDMNAGPAILTLFGSQSYNYAIPILKLPGRTGMDFVLKLYYNSRIWDVDTINSTVTFNADRDYPSYGFRLDYGFLENGGSSFILTEGDGTKHILAQGTDPAKPYMFYSMDGTHIEYNNSTTILRYKSGTTVQYLPFPSTTSLLRPVWIRDSNGNYFSIAYVNGHDQLIYQISGSMGRVITFNYNSSNQLTSLTQLVHPSGTKTYITFTWGNPYSSGYTWYSFSGLAVNGAPTAEQFQALTGCTYANGTGYRFTYGDWGIVTKIETLSSTGATRSYVSYDFPPASQGALTDAPAYTHQTMSPDGGSGNNSVWAYAATKNGTGVVTSMAITDPNGTTSTTNLDATSGLISSVQVKDSSGTLQRQADYTWTTVGLGAPFSTVLDNIVTTLKDTGQQSKIAYSYDPWASVTDVYEYDFGLTLKRHTVTSYLTTGDYVTYHLVDRPTQLLVKDGSGNTVARTDIAYDNYVSTPLTAVTGAANHDDTNYPTSFTTRGNPTSVTRYVNAASGTGVITRTYGYDSLGNLISAQLDCCNQKIFNFSTTTQYSFPDSIVRGPSGGPQFTTSYTYDPDNSLTLSSTDENGQITQYQHDSIGRLTQTTLPAQNGTVVLINTVYGDDTVAPTVTTSSGTSTGGSVPAPVVVKTFDGLGHLMQTDTKNGSTVVSTVKYGYDKVWRRTQASNPYSPGDTMVNTGFSYDALGRITQITPPSGGHTQYSYSGNTVTITDPASKPRKNYNDALGRLIEVDEPGGGSPSAVAGGSLTINGTLRSWSGSAQSASKGHIELTFSGILQSKASCSPSGQPCTDSGKISITVAGFTKTVSYSSSTGTSPDQPLRSIASAFHLDTTSPIDAVYYGVDEFGNYIMDLAARTTGATTNYPLSISIVSDSPANFTPASFQVSSGSSLIGGQDASSGGTIYDSGAVYVSVGTFTASAPYSQNGNNTAAMIASALAGSGSTSLNQMSSPVTATASGATITLTYKSPGAAGNVVVNLTSSTANPDTPSFTSPGTTLSGGVDIIFPSMSNPATTLYSYDPLNDLLQVTQGAQMRTNVYDSLGRVTSATTPESGTVSTYYTDINNQTCSGNPTLPCRVQDAREVTKTLTYDGINRLASVQYSDGTPSVTYTYDTGGAAAFAIDHVTKIAEGTNSKTLTYDNFGRIASAAQIIDGTTYSTSYGYNLTGELTSITYPSGRVVTQGMDSIGRLSSIASGGTTYLNSLSFNAAGEPLGYTLGNTVQATFTYNDHLQLASLRYFKPNAPSDILNLAYDYTTGVTGNNGQIQAMRYYSAPGIEDPTKSEYFTYDPLRRLSSAHTGTVDSTPGTFGLQWWYDQYGNRLSQTLTGGNMSAYQPNFLIDSATNRITNSGYQYDAAGNLISDSTNSYAYDGANRLKQFNGTAASYTYFGPLRIKKTVGGTTTVYIYSGNKPIAEYTNGALSAENIYAGSKLLAVVTPSGTNYYHPDHLSTRAITDSSGATVRNSGTLPFGDTWYVSGNSTKWKFATYERDAESGSVLDYAQFRFYHSPQGRFMSADQLGGALTAPQSLNRYAYVGNDPINLVDPFGLFWIVFEQQFCVDSGGGDVCETELVLVDMGDGGGSGDFGGGGGGAGGGGEGGQGGSTPNNKPSVDIKALFDCIMSLFGINGLSFTASEPGKAGSFGGEGDSQGDFTIINSVRESTGTLTFMAKANGDNDVFTDGVLGYTNGRNPYFNYTARNQDPSNFVNVQVWELGNSLAYITGTVPQNVNQESGPQNTEPGHSLTDCVKNGGPSGGSSTQ